MRGSQAATVSRAEAAASLSTTSSVTAMSAGWFNSANAARNVASVSGRRNVSTATTIRGRVSDPSIEASPEAPCPSTMATFTLTPAKTAAIQAAIAHTDP